MFLKKIIKWQIFIAYYLATMLILFIIAYDDASLLSLASGFIKSIYPQHVVSFFEQFYNFDLHITACFIFIIVYGLVLICIWMISDIKNIIRRLRVYFLICLLSYPLLPFISIVSNVFFNVIDSSDAVDTRLSYPQIICSGFYLLMMIFGLESAFENLESDEARIN